MTATLRPCQARCSPAVSPAGPPPTTAVSSTAAAGEASPEAAAEISAAAPVPEPGSDPMAAVPSYSGIVAEVAPRRRLPTPTPAAVESARVGGHAYTDRITAS